MTQRQRVERLSYAQRERLTYNDSRLYFFGKIGRPDLIERFSVAPAGATRDLALYREIAPQNIAFDCSNKIYRIRQTFSPLTDGSIRMRVRAALAGYMLLSCSVDCSPDHRLKVEQYRLWLSDVLALCGVENAKLAPWYQAPPANTSRKG